MPQLSFRFRERLEQFANFEGSIAADGIFHYSRK